MADKEKGHLLRIGLTTGQTLMLVTAHSVENDLDLMVINSENGDRVEVRKDYVVYVQASEVDLPTDEEIDAYKAKLQATEPTVFGKPVSGAYI